MSDEPHILLVDDERDIREPLAAYLSRNGVRVSKADSAAAAFSAFETRRPLRVR